MTVVPSPFIHLSLVLILLLFANLGICQLLPMPRLFSTSVEVNGELEHPTEFSKYDPIYTGTDLSLRYPLISRLGISVDLKNITKPGKTGGIRRFVTPLASQVIAVVNVGYREMKFRQTPVMESWKLRGGIAGISLTKNFRLFYYSGTVGVSEQLFAYTKRLYPDVRLTLGGAKIYDLKSALFYGAYLRYYNRSVLPVPYVGYASRLSARWNFSVLLPLRAEISYKVSKRYRQAINASINNRSSGAVNYTEFKAAFPNLYYDSFNLKFGASAYLKRSKETDIILSGGFMSDHAGNLYIDNEAFDPLSTRNGIYFKFTLISDFKQSLIGTRGILQSFE